VSPGTIGPQEPLRDLQFEGTWHSFYFT
jgi:hypothetical protein